MVGFCHLWSGGLKDQVHSCYLKENVVAFPVHIVSSSAAQKCYGTLSCHHVVLMWFLSGFTHTIINKRLVSMSRQCELSGELGAAVVKQNTAVLVNTLAYENNIGTFCLHLN